MRPPERGRDERRRPPERMPPSFAPGDKPPRPDSRGARSVGSSDAGATRPMPSAPGAAPVRQSLRPDPSERGEPRGPASPPPGYPPRSSHPAGEPESPRPGPARPAPPPRAPRRRRRRGRRFLTVLVLLLVLVLAWPVGLLIWANGQINHIPALSDASGTPGRTFLLAGSDSRADGAAGDATEGERSDTIMLLHRPSSGPAALVSLPRDTYVEIPGHGANKLNAAYSFGGPELLVETVEGLTGLTVDHYVEIGMAGVRDVVDAVGGVELCLDYDVDDWRSRLEWEAGCHEVDGETALAFARMRYADPDGDIGRTERQRQIVSAIISEAATPATLLDPRGHVDLLGSGLDSIVVDEDTGIIDLVRMALAFRAATGADGLIGPPPIADRDYRPGGIGSAVLLDPDLAPDFFARLRDGDLTDADFE